MINYDTAFKMAENYFKKLHMIIVMVSETESFWIFDGHDPKYIGSTMYGGPGPLSIDKSTGEMKELVLPNKENFKILRESVLVWKLKK